MPSITSDKLIVGHWVTYSDLKPKGNPVKVGIMSVLPELINLPDFGTHSKCKECAYTLSCMSGAFEYITVAKTRKEQREGKSLPCVDDGLVRLLILTEQQVSDIEVELPYDLIPAQPPPTIENWTAVPTVVLPNTNFDPEIWEDYAAKHYSTGKLVIGASTNTNVQVEKP